MFVESIGLPQQRRPTIKLVQIDDNFRGNDRPLIVSAIQDITYLDVPRITSAEVSIPVGKSESFNCSLSADNVDFARNERA